MMLPRALFADARRAPWGSAAPLAIVMSVVLATALVVADGGGWRLVLLDFGLRSGSAALGLSDGSVVVYAVDGEGFWSGTLLGATAGMVLLFSGALLLTICALLAVLAASRGRRVVAVLLAALMAVALGGWTGLSDARLAYTTVVLREAGSPSTGTGEVAVSITMSAVVGLLVFAALLVALWWAVAGRRARRQGVPEARPTWGASVRLVVLALLVALPLPRIGRWLRDAGQAVLGEPSGPVDALDAGGQQTVYLFVAAALVFALAAALLPRRVPSLALAAVIVMAALWLPFGWVVGGLLPDALIGGGLAILVFWAAWITAGTLAALSVASRTTPDPVTR